MVKWPRDARPWRAPHHEGLRPHPEEPRVSVASRRMKSAGLPVRIGIGEATPAAAVERRPFSLGLRQPIGDRKDRGGMMAHAAMTAFDFDAFGHRRGLFAATFP